MTFPKAKQQTYKKRGFVMLCWEQGCSWNLCSSLLLFLLCRLVEEGIRLHGWAPGLINNKVSRGRAHGAQELSPTPTPIFFWNIIDSLFFTSILQIFLHFYIFSFLCYLRRGGGCKIFVLSNHILHENIFARYNPMFAFVKGAQFKGLYIKKN